MFEHLIYDLIDQFGYVGIFLTTVLGILTPLPMETLMTFCGVLVSGGQLAMLPTVLLFTAGAYVGMVSTYVVGSRFGVPLLEKFGGKIGLNHDRLHKLHGWFNKVGKPVVFIGYFIPGVRHFTGVFAGIGKWPFATFTLYALPGAVIWAVVFLILGSTIGDYWQQIVHFVSHHPYWSSLLGLTILIGLWWWKIYLPRRTNATQ